MALSASKSRSPKKIFVVDDHPLFREGLVRVLNREKDMEVCGEAIDGSSAMEQIEAARPDLALVDISLEGMNGIELTKQLRNRHPNLLILVLSMHKESLHAGRALRAGANGYIMKREDGTTLIAAIRQVLSGGVYVSKAVNDSMLQKMANNRGEPHSTPADTLSDRELEIFGLIGQGYGTRQMADQLSISIKTIETHRERIREKLNISSTVELVQQAIHWFHHES